jgi:glucan biosynthesis protein
MTSTTQEERLGDAPIMSEPTDQILSAIAHELTGLVAANCCAKTGGRGGPAASKHCECRETALDVYRAAAPLIEAAVLEEAAKALAGIKWRSADRDNMEFTATITYSQMDAIRALKEQP